MTPDIQSPPVSGTSTSEARTGLSTSQFLFTFFAGTLLSLAFWSLIVAVLSLVFAGRLTMWTLPVAVAATSVWVFRTVKQVPCDRPRATAAVVAAAAIAVFGVGALIGELVLDTTYDGRRFHTEAVLQLVDDWNPLAAEISQIQAPDEASRGRINGYAKSPWFLASSVFMITGRIETSTAFSFVLLVAAAAMTYAAILGLGGVGRWTAAGLAVVAAGNPIALCQLTNPLVDGQLGSIVLITISAGLLVHRTGSGLALWVLVMGIMIGLNTKQSAVPILVMIVTGLILTSIVVRRRLPETRLLAAVFAAFVLGVGAIGAHPYLTNISRYGNWAHPHEEATVTGTQKSVIPGGRMSRAEAFVLSAFSHPRNAPTLWDSRTLLATDPRLKNPFSVTRSDLRQYRTQGVRIGGWGPFFGAMLLLGHVGFLVLLWDRPRAAGFAFLITFVLAGSVLAFPFPWCARLVPHSWLLPLVPCAAGLMGSRRLTKAVGWVVVLVGLINLSLVAWVYTSGKIQRGDRMRDQLEKLARRGPVDVDLGVFRADRVRLAEYGVPIREVADESYSLGLYLGWQRPKIEKVVRLKDEEGPKLRVRWQPIQSALEYRVEVFEQAPAGPGAGALTVFSETRSRPEAIIPRPEGPFTFALSACNRLGCGPPVLSGSYKGSDSRRPRPILSVPSQGTAPGSPFLMAWMPSSDAEIYRVIVEDAETGMVEIDESTTERYLMADLPAHRQWNARIEAKGDDIVVSSSVVSFETTAMRAPRPLEPAFGSMTTEGAITLRWSGVDGAGVYEYLVTRPGGSRAVARGVTTRLSMQVNLTADRGPTMYSAIVRACALGAACRQGRDRGWGEWSTVAGTGAVTFTVVPDTEEVETLSGSERR